MKYSILIFLFIFFYIFTNNSYSANYDYSNTSFNELMAYIQDWGNTQEKREKKAAAQAEIFKRKTESLKYLLENSYIRNDMINITTGQLLDKLTKEEVIPILLEFLKHPNVDVQKNAINFLANYDVKEKYNLLLPFLNYEKTMGVTLRTLGKWKSSESVPYIVPYITHKTERIRIYAVNALKDIATENTILPLIEALKDQIFTIRKSASKGLIDYQLKAEKNLLATLNEIQNITQLREIIFILGEIKSYNSINILAKLLFHEDHYVRIDTALALWNIDRSQACTLIKNSPVINEVKISESLETIEIVL